MPEPRSKQVHSNTYNALLVFTYQNYTYSCYSTKDYRPFLWQGKMCIILQFLEKLFYFQVFNTLEKVSISERAEVVQLSAANAP